MNFQRWCALPFKHNLQDGMIERIDGGHARGWLQTINGQEFPVTLISTTTFSIPFDNTDRSIRPMSAAAW